MRKIFLLLIWHLIIYNGALQSQTQDSVASISMVHGTIGMHIPGGDMDERFGTNFLAGSGFQYKTDKNWLFGFSVDFLFSENVKENDVFRELETENGYLIDASGLYADVFLSERGFRTGLSIGKVIPLNKKNLNSGLMITVSPGLLQHKIRIENRNNAAPQVDDDYAKGYDRLTNGFCLTEFVGYYYSGKYRLISFYAGMEFNQAWTRSRRDLDYDTMRKDETERFDLLNGIKVGWIIQLSRSASNEYFYY